MSNLLTTDQAAERSAAGPLALRSCRLADVQPESVAFLWPPYLPLRKLTLLEGDPGQGKSWVTTAIAASGSRGQGLPCMESFEPFRSLFFSAEDGTADTLRPRLEALALTSSWCTRTTVRSTSTRRRGWPSSSAKSPDASPASWSSTR